MHFLFRLAIIVDTQENFILQIHSLDMRPGEYAPIIREWQKSRIFYGEFMEISVKTAILVDGGFYRRRAYLAYGDKSPKERADELVKYCHRHLTWHNENSELYRIFYYDCPPLETQVYHPFLKKAVFLKKSPTYQWTNDFFDELKKKRKVALRLGEISDISAKFVLKDKVLRQLCRGEKDLLSLSESDFTFTAEQKGVDMRIGLDIASMAFKHQINRVVLISGDSDFVPAAKMARREGLDFILDPLYTNIKPKLIEHVDGIRTCDNAFKPKRILCIKETP